jgi:predicted TIM-barrel fold metal-dependent hydrolase
MGAVVVDSDQHLYETRDLWRTYCDPADRDVALSLDDDERGYTWLTWRDEPLELADVHKPGDVGWCGEHRERWRRGEPSSYSYDEILPDSYWDPAARVAWLDATGVDEAVCFPNYGLLWERRLSGDGRALVANMAAWNRWCVEVRSSSSGRLHPVAHLTLRDTTWAIDQLRMLSDADVRLAMIAPAPVDGRPLSHPDLEPVWAAFVDHGVTPVFHVADQPRVFDDCWYADETAFVPTVESVFLWVPPALAITDLILNGVLDRHPDLRIGIVELSSIWVPQYLLMLDGGFDFTARLNGRPQTPLALRPSEYVRRQVRVSSFSYEDPARLTRLAGDLFMCCSDFPHSEGTDSPVDDYRTAGCDPSDRPGLFDDNVGFLLRR